MKGKENGKEDCEFFGIIAHYKIDEKFEKLYVLIFLFYFQLFFHISNCLNSGLVF